MHPSPSFHSLTSLYVVQVISTEQRQFESWELTSEGSEVVEKGSHEARVYSAVDPENGTPQAEIMVLLVPQLILPSLLTHPPL